MSCTQFHCIKMFILRHAWLNLWDKHMTTGRINQVTTIKWTATRPTQRTTRSCQKAWPAHRVSEAPPITHQSSPKTRQCEFMTDINCSNWGVASIYKIMTWNRVRKSRTKRRTNASSGSAEIPLLAETNSKIATNTQSLLELFLERRWTRHRVI
jgi:hypothetical protein